MEGFATFTVRITGKIKVGHLSRRQKNYERPKLPHPLNIPHGFPDLGVW